MIDQIISDVKPKMKSSIDNMISELQKIRTGRANAGILDEVRASYYGSPTPIREMASVTTPESNVIAIKPWDKGTLAAIETAIRASDIGLAPINDGVQIRLVLPPMTEERRKEIVQQARKISENAKIAVRNIRGEAWSKVGQAIKSNEATEDDKYRAEEELNKITLEKNKEIDKIIADKEAEIMKI